MNNEQLNNNVINNGTTPNTPQNGNNTLNMNSTQYVNNPEQAQRNNVNNDVNQTILGQNNTIGTYNTTQNQHIEKPVENIVPTPINTPNNINESSIPTNNTFTNENIGINNNINIPPTNNQTNTSINIENKEMPTLTPNYNALNNISNLENPEESKNTKEKKSKIGIILLIIILLLAIGAGIYYYFFIYNTPKKLLTEFLNTTYTKAEEKITNINDNTNYSIKTNLQTTDTETAKIFNVINSLTINGKASINTNTNTIISNINVLYEEESILDIDAILKNNNFYLKPNDLYDKYILLETEEENNIDVTSKDEYKILLTAYKDAIINSLTDENITKESVKINNSNVTKITLNIDETFLKNIYNELISNDKFIISYANISNKTKEEVIQELENERNEITNSQSNKFILCLNKSKFISAELLTENESIKIAKEGNKYSYEYIDEEKNTYKGYIITSDNSMTINYYDTSTNSTYEFTINYTKNNEEITTPDLTNSINSNDMTLDDTMEIMSKLQENKKLEKFITDLGLIES